MAYFQQGVSNFLVGDFEEALANFNDTLLYLRGNTYIDYEQLGLKFKLYSCEVLFNRGLCYIYLQQTDTGMEDLNFAVKEKVTPDHDVIDDAIQEQAEGYTVFSIPVGIVYRPNASKVKNLQTRDYLGKARLVASTDTSNAFTGFAGTARQPVITSADAKDDRPTDGISFAASNLVRNDITSRSMRQASEPPTNRNVFPPTPPPEDGGRPNKTVTMPPPSAIPSGMRTARANSVKNGEGFSLAVRTASKRSANTPSIDEDDYSPGTRAPAPGPLRTGTVRSSSEPRGPAGPGRYGSISQQRGYGSVSQASRGYGSVSLQRGYGSVSQRGYGNGPPPSRSRLFGEQRPQEDIEEYDDELYDMYNDSEGYGNGYNGGNRSQRKQSQWNRGSYEQDHDSFSEELDDFEMMEPAPGRRNTTAGATRRPSRAVRNGGGGGAADGDIRSVRVKMHYEDDTRYIMCGTNVDFEEFQDKVRDKLELRNRIRIKIKDEGDLITVGDADDWNMQVIMARKSAKRDGDDMARMEVSSI